MNWHDSELMCRKKGMRLPELKEMQMAQESKLMDEWRKEINAKLIPIPAFWLAVSEGKDAYIFPIHVKIDGYSVSVEKKSKELVRCVRDLKMERIIKSSKPIANWSSYQGYMTKNAAVEQCKQIGMRLPSNGEIRQAYFDRITNEWNKEDDSENFSYWTNEEVPGFTLFTPGDGIFSSSGGKFLGNAHVRCIRAQN